MTHIYKKSTFDKNLPDSTLIQIRKNINAINFKRLTYFFIAMLVIEPFIIALFDIQGMLQIDSQKNWVYISYFIIHSLLWFLSLIWILARRFLQNRCNENCHLIAIGAALVLVLLAMVNGLDQLKEIGITVYIAYVLMFGIALLFTFPTNLFVILPSYIVFVFGILLFQANPDDKVSSITNGSIFFLAVIVISSYLYQTYFENSLYTLELKIANEKLNYLSTHDSLTGLLNRFEFENQLSLLNQATSQKVALILLDVDYFKNVNDCYGHLIGDQILIEIAKTITTVVPIEFLVSRWGGEEFLIAGPMENMIEALSMAELIRINIAQKTFTSDQGKINITASLGVSLMTGDNPDVFEPYFKETDDSLYRAKEKGRNRVESSQNLNSKE
ncbi:GGDEF domain-containing protein [Acetobacterium woodii]|uniref:Putative membrane protein containing diguanylate cyclase domain n=1 Tax=Acetobacterium woodii (strain ATCC 29683 / DSM 1030 / JCM 2381 / KCTC 1655 / WB1) TaxID=931626 RepID=H6LKR5_ACEWD|nr:GGDEF domain-containing protein [Acetobacterium woodii]AFA48857.1 putative membrane protein containing diguanylate cyclase domain [Acetobacterium woodii DSM 1030]